MRYLLRRHENTSDAPETVATISEGIFVPTSTENAGVTMASERQPIPTQEKQSLDKCAQFFHLGADGQDDGTGGLGDGTREEGAGWPDEDARVSGAQVGRTRMRECQGRRLAMQTR